MTDKDGKDAMRTQWTVVLETGKDGDDQRALRGIRWICKTALRGWGLKVIKITDRKNNEHG